MTELTDDAINALLGDQTAQAKAPHAKCWECPLKDKHFVPSSGPANAEVALVSRSPGAYDTTGPFTGPSGKVVDFLLEKYGYNREKVLLTNVVLCQTDAPPNKAIEACRPRLLDEISSCTTIIAGGTEAVSSLTKFRSVSAARGYVHENSRGQRIIAANNPALVMKESDVFPTLLTDFKLALDPIPTPTFPQVEVINDPLVAKDLLRGFKELSHCFATDLEWHGTRIYCAGFAEDGQRATVFGKDVIRDPECFSYVADLYTSRSTTFVWHNGKSDTSVLWQNGIEGRIDHDTFLLSYALDEEPGRHSLDYLLQTKLGWPDYEPESVKHFKKTGTFDYYGVDEESRARAEQELYIYNGWDCAGTYQLWNILQPEAIADDVFDKPYKKTLLPTANAFRAVELHGFRFDPVKAANLLESDILPRLRNLTAQMQEISGYALLNPRSNPQMAVVYYDHFGLKHKLRNKAKVSYTRSVGKEVREEIAGGRTTCKPQYKNDLAKFAEVHREYAKIEKQRGTYFVGLIDKCDENNYIHPSFNEGGTVTGRPSSREPNLQNVTREGVEGIPSIRECFLASDGCMLVSADYSQAELRTMAKLSGEPNLLQIYSDNTRSLHKERAAAFYGPNYTKEEYVKSKNINFGVSYWQSAQAFAQMYHMPKEEAQAYIDSWWREFPTLYRWTEAVANNAIKTGVTISPHGYKRRLHLITKDNIEDSKREAINFLPQNIAVVFTLQAMAILVLEYNIPIVNMVHDNLLADVPEDQAMDTAKLIKEVMESRAKEALDWDLPFTVDVSMGKVWAHLKEVEL